MHQSGRDSTASLRIVTEQEGTNANTWEMQPNPLHFPLEQQTRYSTPSRPNQQQASYSKREGTTPQPRLLSTQNSLATCLNTVPGPKSAHVYLCLRLAGY
ncbi:hypothetical protein E2C01_098483 [Portunus trituberculatus]|uniref:Uncharacterized protein n=1 Tax=Portunus trituberculatus TaxID=210409 RepID=A0A5B7K7S3_PORTR|nr:hypothetical protein [Portunus trituberculatus]